MFGVSEGVGEGKKGVMLLVSYNWTMNELKHTEHDITINSP